jgi:hypothetical protein
MRGWICNLLAQVLLGLVSAVTLGSKSRGTCAHILLSHLRLGSLSVASHDRRATVEVLQPACTRTIVRCHVAA